MLVLSSKMAKQLKTQKKFTHRKIALNRLQTRLLNVKNGDFKPECFKNLRPTDRLVGFFENIEP